MKFFLFSTFLILLCYAGVYAQIDAQKSVNDAAVLREAGKYDEAIVLLTNAISDAPSSSILYLERARDYLKTKNKEAFFEDIRKAGVLKADRRALIEAMIVPCAENVLLMDELIKAAPSLSAAYEKRGVCKFVLKDYPGAFDDVLKSQELADVLDITNAVGIVGTQSIDKLNDEQTMSAWSDRLLQVYQTAYDKLIKFSPSNSYDVIRKGQCIDSVQMLRRMSLSTLATFFKAKGFSARSSRLMDDIVAIEPKSDSYFYRSQYFSKKGMTAEAEADERSAQEYRILELTELLNKGLNMWGRRADNGGFDKSNLLILRGDCFFALGRFEEAIKDYQEAKIAAPFNKERVDEKLDLVYKKIKENAPIKN